MQDRQRREALDIRQKDGVENMKGIEKQFTSIQQMTDQYLTQKNDAAADAGSRVSFEEVLRQTSQTKTEYLKDTATAGISPLKFSKHASMRLQNRNINLSREQNERLETGVRKAGEKGIHDSLVIVDSLAFIVNIPNKTVVTALEKSEADESIFTNIDGAVIM